MKKFSGFSISNNNYMKNIMVTVLLAGLLILLIVFSFVLNDKRILQSKAALQCDAQCQTEPSCCARIIQRYHELGGTKEDLDELDDSEQPYHECPGLYESNNERGYCKPSTCNQLPEGLKYRGRCGWYWGFHEGYTNSADGYGCMIGSADNMRPICDGGTNPTATPDPGKPTTPPGGGGTLTVLVHQGSANGPVWTSTTSTASPYTDKKSLLVYITGPSSNGHTFGELLNVPGKNGEQCSSKSGFPYGCSAGTVTWKGSDGKAGTSAGSYSVQLSQVPSGMTIVKENDSGNLANGATLTLHLVVSGQAGNPTATPPPGTTATPPLTNTPSPTSRATTGPNSRLSPTIQPTGVREIKSENPIVEAIQKILLPPSPTPDIYSPSILPSLTSHPIIETITETGTTGLDIIGAFIQRVRYYDTVLEQTIQERFQRLLGR